MTAPLPQPVEGWDDAPEAPRPAPMPLRPLPLPPPPRRAQNRGANPVVSRAASPVANPAVNRGQNLPASPVRTPVGMAGRCTAILRRRVMKPRWSGFSGSARKARTVTTAPSIARMAPSGRSSDRRAVRNPDRSVPSRTTDAIEAVVVDAAAATNAVAPRIVASAVSARTNVSVNGLPASSRVAADRSASRRRTGAVSAAMDDAAGTGSGEVVRRLVMAAMKERRCPRRARHRHRSGWKARCRGGSTRRAMAVSCAAQ